MAKSHVLRLAAKEGTAELALIIQKQVLGVVKLLEELSPRVVVGRNLLLLAIEAPADLVAATVVPDLLEGLARLNVGELLALLILAEIGDKASDCLGTRSLTGDLLLQVLVDVFLNLFL